MKKWMALTILPKDFCVQSASFTGLYPLHDATGSRGYFANRASSNDS
jgi:hypothetical protein